MRDCSQSRGGFAYDTENIEIKALIGILAFFRFNKNSKSINIKYLGTSWKEQTVVVNCYKSDKVDIFLFRLRFDNYSTRNERKLCNKLAPSKELFNNFVTACVENYSPDPNCSINESFMGFRGRYIFKQYIPNKPSKNGIKVFALTDSQSSYFLNSIIYA